MQLCGWWWAGGSEAELVTLLARYTPPKEIVWFRMLATCATHSCNDAHFAVRLDEKLDGQESKSSSRVRELEQLKKESGGIELHLLCGAIQPCGLQPARIPMLANSVWMIPHGRMRLLVLE